MKSFYSLEEVISASKNTLSVNDIKHYCRIGQLHPCIYFEGNLVCIGEERHQDDIYSNALVVHIEEVKWSMIFKGYIHFSKLIDHLDPKYSSDSGIFFNVDKIIEFITQPTTYAPLIPPSNGQYLKAFPRMIDDDIKKIRWLVEATDFKGNEFHSSEIIFPSSEINDLFSLKNNTVAVNSDNPILSHTNEIPISAQENDPEILFKESNPTSLSDQLEIMNQQLQKLEKEKLEYLKKIERLELEVEIKNDDIIKASVNNGLLSAIVKKLEDRQSITVDELIHLQKNGRCEFININEKVYTTPALEAVYGVIKEYWSNYDPESNQPPPKQSTVTNWIKEHFPAVQAEDICKYIDKICRHPKAKRGGNIKVINNKIPPKASPQ